MQKTRAEKKICWLLSAVMLLAFAFFSLVSVQEDMERFPVERQILRAETMGEEEVIGLPEETDARLPGDKDYITMARILTGSFHAGGQNGSRISFLRFLAVVWALFSAASAGWRFAIRRQSCKMIALWKSIFYIHRSDGEKGRILCMGH